MGRLIDAGLFLNNLSGRLESMRDYDAVKEVINNIPTAYDPDEVVEWLKKRSVSVRQVGWTRKREIVTLKDAIDIVEKNGKEKKHV